MFLWNLLFLAIQVIPICLFLFHPWIIVKKKWPLFRQFSVYLKSGPISRAVYGERGLIGLGLWCLTPLSTIFQLYHGEWV